MDDIDIQDFPPPTPAGSLAANIVGFGMFGLAARFGQLAILKRNMWSKPWGHALSVGFWSYFGYNAYYWNKAMEEYIWEKRQEITARRADRARKLEELAQKSAALAQEAQV